METIEQKQRRLLFERFKLARAKYTFEELAQKYGKKKQQLSFIYKALEKDKNYNLRAKTICGLTKLFDELGIKKVWVMEQLDLEDIIKELEGKDGK